MTHEAAWRAAHRLLRARADAAPALVREAAKLALPPLPFDPAAAGAIVATGVGSSGAHAKLLAHLLAVDLGLPARFAPPGAVQPSGAGSDALIVFSQGLSPNARVALRHPDAWLGIILVTAVGSPGSRPAHRPARATRSARRGRRGGTPASGTTPSPTRIMMPGGAERGTLLRLAGPLAGYALAVRLAAAIGGAAGRALPDLDIARITARMRAAALDARRLAPRRDPFAGTVALIAGHGYGELADNLRLKLLEGLYEPVPPVTDLLEVAHGPFQALYDRAATFIALERHGAPGEADLIRRFAGMLVPERHRLLRLPAKLPGPLALFEHESALNELVLAAIAARRLDQADWPGRGRDRPLYEVANIVEGAAPPAPQRHRTPARAATTERRPPGLAELCWPDIDARLAAGRRTAVIPLGSTEQHGDHLPFATDTLIAEALAARLCARIGAVHTPPLALGCAAEHATFAGSLSVRWNTLRAMLEDTAHSLARHGFRSILVFSAHGGNAALLHDAAADLAAAARPATLRVCADLEAMTAVFHRASAAAGVPPAAAGHHAGEFETSILLALRPDLVRRDAFHPGLTDAGSDPQALFYPNLRANAPTGVVGDPTQASATRGAAYLDAWVDHLATCLRES